MSVLSILITISFIGPLVAPLIHIFGCRYVHIVGGLVSSIGLLITAFSKNHQVLIFSFGLTTGIGYGMCFLPSISAVNDHFKEYKNFAIGLASCGAGLGSLVGPAMIRMIYNRYSYLGCHIILSAFSLHLVVCGALLFPTVKTIPESTSLSKTKKIPDKGSRLTKNLCRFIRCDIFSNMSFLLLCLNNVLYTICISIVGIHFGAYASTLGHNETVSAMLFSCMGFSNLLSRIPYIICGTKIGIKPLTMYTLAFIVGAVSCFLCLLFRQYYQLMIFAIFYGAYIAMVNLNLPLVVIDLLSADSLSAGYGFLLVFEAIGQAAGGPVAGILYTFSGYYGSTLILAGAVNLIAALILFKPCIQRVCSLKERNLKTQVVYQYETATLT